MKTKSHERILRALPARQIPAQHHQRYLRCLPDGTFALDHGAINVSFCDCDVNYEGDGGLTRGLRAWQNQAHEGQFPR